MWLDRINQNLELFRREMEPEHFEALTSALPRIRSEDLMAIDRGFPPGWRFTQQSDAYDLSETGWAAHQRGQYEEALEYYRQGLAMHPDFPMLWNNKGLAHFRLKQFDEAKSAYYSAIKCSPLFVKPYSNIGILYYELRQDDSESSRWFRIALVIDPDNHRAETYLAQINTPQVPQRKQSADYLVLGFDAESARLAEAMRRKGKNVVTVGGYGKSPTDAAVSLCDVLLIGEVEYLKQLADELHARGKAAVVIELAHVEPAFAIQAIRATRQAILIFGTITVSTDRLILEELDRAKDSGKAVVHFQTHTASLESILQVCGDR